MAGSISLSLSQQFDEYGKPLSGGLLYTIQAGTTATPQNSFKDYGLSIVHPNPIILDAAGRVPAFYLADGQIKIRLTDKNGVDQIVQDNLLVIGPSSGGGGGGGGVDATTVMATGDIKARYGTGSLAGFVRLNGRTIGSATSGANERANIDCGPLFQYLWGADTSLTVSGGRGVSAVADWNANKTIILPDGRGRVLAALDDMGNTAAGRLSTSYFGTDGTTLGAAGGAENITMALANMIQHDHTAFLHDPGHVHNSNSPFQATAYAIGSGGPPASYSNNVGGQLNWNTSSATTGITLWSDGDNSGTQNKVGKTGSATPTPMRTVQPTILMTFYIKL